MDKQIASNVVVLRYCHPYPNSRTATPNAECFNAKITVHPNLTSNPHSTASDAIRSFAPPQDFKKVQDLITYANDMLAQERQNREEAVSVTEEKVMEQVFRLHELIESEQLARQDLATQLEAIDMHEMFLQFQLDIERERRVFEERLEGTKRKVLAEVQITLGKVEGETTARKEQHVELGVAIDSEMGKFSELLDAFKRAGAVSESAFIKILEDVTYAIQRKVMVRKTGLRGPVNKR